MPGRIFILGQTPKSDIPPNIAPKIITPGNYLQIWDSSATLIGQLATVTVFGAILGGIALSGPYTLFYCLYVENVRECLRKREELPPTSFGSIA